MRSDIAFFHVALPQGAQASVESRPVVADAVDRVDAGRPQGVSFECRLTPRAVTPGRGDRCRASGPLAMHRGLEAIGEAAAEVRGGRALSAFVRGAETSRILGVGERTRYAAQRARRRRRASHCPIRGGHRVGGRRHGRPYCRARRAACRRSMRPPAAARLSCSNGPPIRRR